MIPFRDSQPSYTFPWVTFALIGLNAIVFFFSLSLSNDPSGAVIDLHPWHNHNVVFMDQKRFTYAGSVSLSPKQKFVFEYGVVPGELTSLSDLPPELDPPMLPSLPIYLTLITSTFLHGGLFHILGNMLFLWIFGDNIEEALGHIRFILFYFTCGAGAAVFQIVANPSSGIPMVGASGAIAGVMAAYFLLYPNSQVLTLIPVFFFFTFIEIPAFLLLGLWFIFQLISTPSSGGSGVAFLAHVGGFLTGAFLTPYFKKKQVPIKLFRYFRRWRR